MENGLIIDGVVYEYTDLPDDDYGHDACQLCALREKCYNAPRTICSFFGSTDDNKYFSVSHKTLGQCLNQCLNWLENNIVMRHLSLRELVLNYIKHNTGSEVKWEHGINDTVEALDEFDKFWYDVVLNIDKQ